MEDIEHGRPIQFITERRITEGYEKNKITYDSGYSFTRIQKIGVDNDSQ